MTKKVFISYAHHDATLFTSRLAAQLEHYYETFWDSKLQAGIWDSQLENAIRTSDAFIVVMSKAREKSDACEWEYQIAQDQFMQSLNQPEIIPVKVFDNYEDSSLTHWQYINFFRHHDEGFRDLTYKISKERLSAWEYLGDENAEILLQHLKDGHLPGLIAMELGDWIVVDQLWGFFYNTILKKYKDKHLIYRRTPKGVLDVVPQLFGIAHDYIDSIVAAYAQDLQKIVKAYIDACPNNQDVDASTSGKAVHEIYVATRKLCVEYKAGFLDANGVSYYLSNFELDVAEKLRELITLYARRSRHLY